MGHARRKGAYNSPKKPRTLAGLWASRRARRVGAPRRSTLLLVFGRLARASGGPLCNTSSVALSVALCRAHGVAHCLCLRSSTPADARRDMRCYVNASDSEQLYVECPRRLFRTRIATCYPCHEVEAPEFVPGSPHVPHPLCRRRYGSMPRERLKAIASGYGIKQSMGHAAMVEHLSHVWQAMHAPDRSVPTWPIAGVHAQNESAGPSISLGPRPY